MIEQLLLDTLWQGAVIVACAAGVTAMLPQRNASTRYAVWFVALLALPLVPLLTTWHPVPLPSSPVARVSMATTVITARSAVHGINLIALLWLCGFAWSLLRLGISFARIRRIVNDATPAPHLGSYVMLSRDVTVPIAAGIFSPAIVVPQHLAETLDPVDLELIVRHERAHLKRGDVAGNLIQRLLESMLFFNPWAYVVGRRLVVEREAACDDWAVATTGHSDRYALCLAQLARDVRRSHTPILTPSAIGPKNLIVGRIARLLNGKVAQLKINYFVLGTSVAIFAALAFALQTPKSVAATNLAATTAATQSCNREATVTNPAPPDIPQGSYRGTVVATALVTIAPDGQVTGAKIAQSSGYPGVDNATIAAATHSTYSAAISNCKPVAGQYLFKVRATP